MVLPVATGLPDWMSAQGLAEVVNGSDAREEIVSPLIAHPHEKGIKRMGIIYSPRKSWWAGMVFVALSILIFMITIVTAFVQ